jgi:hypothetical protein
MVTRGFALGASLAVVLAAASTAPARADSPKLADARRAVEAVDYDAARRLLLEALRDGGNAPAAVAEIYRLLARAAIVLDDRNVAEQYYRRWLAIDPAAALPADAAPKLREPFVAAQSYIAAHGRLLARAERTPTGEIDVELVADPLAMARAARALDPAGAPSPFGSDRRARLPAGARVAILDDNGNRLLELEPAAAPVAATRPSSTGPGSTGLGSTGSNSPTGQMSAPATPNAVDTRPWTRHWFTWAIPTAAFGLVGTGFGVAALASYERARMINADSGRYFLDDAEDNVRRGRTFIWVSAGAGVLTIAFAIPTAIFFLRQRDQSPALVVPTAGDGRVGAALIGRF